jgi:hypothetical protein
MWEGEALAPMGSDRDLPDVSSPPRADRELTERWAGGGFGDGPTAAPLAVVGDARCWAARSLPDASDAGLGGSRPACTVSLDVAACNHIGRASPVELRGLLPGMVPRSRPAWRIDTAPGIDGSGHGARVRLDRQMSLPLPEARRVVRHRACLPGARRVEHGAAGEHGRARR